MKAMKRAAVLLLAAMIVCSCAVYAMEIPVKQTEQMINGKQTLVKVFEVSADYDPQRLIERGLAQDGYTYEMTSIVKEVLTSETDIEISDTAVITVQVADENAARLEALKSMPAYIDYDVDGYTGKMYPIVASLSGQITSETPHSGTNRKVRTYSYPTNDDTQVPTTLDGYKLTGITWSEGPFLEGTTIPESYTASWSVSKGLMINCKGRPQTDIELQKFILHMAGSTADGTSGSNSVEAADNSYKKGYRWLEIDFNWTTDGKLVCIHDWGQWNNRFRTGKNGAVSYDEFQRVCAAANIYHPFTPASLETWLKNHSGAMIVTDVKDNNVKAMRWLKQNNPELMDRLIVQIYSFDEYEQVSALGYKHIILTMYKLSWADYHDFDKIDTFIRDTDVLAITMAAVDYTQDVFEHIKATGVPVYVHTLNTGSEQNAWLRKGAYGIYTDVGDAR